MLSRGKGRDLTQSYDKSPYPNRKKNQKSIVTTQKRHQNVQLVFTRRLRTDLGWSVGVTKATQQMWLAG